MTSSIYRLYRSSPLIRNCVSSYSRHTNANTNATRTTSIKQQKRLINQCLHIKGLPSHLSRDVIYEFMQDYGSIQQIACYDEAAAAALNQYKKDGKKYMHKRNNKFNHDTTSPSNTTTPSSSYSPHERPPGQTAIVKFENVQSAIMCKEELHWRPFPDMKYTLDTNIISTNPKNRSLVNIIYETSTLQRSLKPKIQKELHSSTKWIRRREKDVDVSE